MNPLSTEDNHAPDNGEPSGQYSYWVDDPRCENDEAELKRLLPKLFLGHSIRYWVLWTFGAITVAIWLGPLLAELTNWFVVRLW